MKHTCWFAVTLTSAALAASAAQAQPSSNFYAVASVGYSDTSFRPTVNDVIDDDDQSFEVGIGYAFNRYLSVQGSYHDFGEPTGFANCPPGVLCITVTTPEPVEVDGWSASVIGHLPLGERLSLFGKAGILSWDTSASSSSLDDSGEDLLVGAGVSWQLTDRWGVELAYERVDLDIDSGKLGVAFRF